MHRSTVSTLLAVSTCVALTACANDTALAPRRFAPDNASRTTGTPINTGSKERYTLAVIGDTPYGDAKVAELPSLIALMNGDPKVDIVVHLGDIKAGKASPCTDEYFAMVKGIYDNLKDPFVYTPGDNEWTDCHVFSKNNGLYTPTERLQAIRALFFPVPGQTLGGRKKQVLTQADDPANSAYVENVIWMESQVVFATVNITGSNNDLAPWGSPLPANAGDFPSQAQEFATRAQADAAWIQKAFAIAADNNAVGVVLAFQADMWDPAEPTLSGFDAVVQQIGTLGAAFRKPVLLLEGDSHRFEVQQPFSANSPLRLVHPNTPIAENITRLVVEGSDGRTEYVRLTVDPKSPASPFSWERVPLHT
jgi:hypothetical protein